MIILKELHLCNIESVLRLFKLTWQDKITGTEEVINFSNIFLRYNLIPITQNPNSKLLFAYLGRNRGGTIILRFKFHGMKKSKRVKNCLNMLICILI